MINNARRKKRRMKRIWKKSRSQVDEELFRLQKELVGKLITESQIRFFTDKCISANSKEMNGTINDRLNKPSEGDCECVLDRLSSCIEWQASTESGQDRVFFFFFFFFLHLKNKFF